MRTTLYRDAPIRRRQVAFAAAPLAQISNASAAKHQRSKRVEFSNENLAMCDDIQIVKVQLAPDPGLFERVMLMAACN